MAVVMNKVQPLIVFILTVIMIPSSFVIYGQVNFGVKAGVNMAKGSFNDAETKFDAKFNAGVISEVNFNEAFFIRPELAYSVKGWKLTDASLNLHYFNLPILLGFRPIPKLSVVAGPEFGYLLKAERRPDGSSMPGYEKFDYAIALGASYRIVRKLSLDIRYTHGFDTLIKATGRDVNNSPTGEVYRDGANRVIFVGLSYLFKDKQ